MVVEWVVENKYPMAKAPRKKQLSKIYYGFPEHRSDLSIGHIEYLHQIASDFLIVNIIVKKWALAE